jgi:hypothetical protein
VQPSRTHFSSCSMTVVAGKLECVAHAPPGMTGGVHLDMLLFL